MNPQDRELPFSLRELLEANRARLQENWMGFAFLLAKLHNVNCTEKRQCLTPDDFDMYGEKRAKKPMRTLREQIHGIKARMTGG